MEFRVLGPIGVAGERGELLLGAGREAALLADLLTHANAVVPAARLIDDLWRGDPPPGAAATLHSHVRNLRRLLVPDRAVTREPPVLETRRPGYVLHVDELDAWSAERLIKAGQGALAEKAVDRAARMLAAALELWRGRPFGELATESFVEAEAARLDELRLVAVETRAEADLALGRHSELCGELDALVAEHPYRERLWAHLMLALYRAHRQADALRAYQRIRRLLGEDLGIEPGRALSELEQAILLHDPELDPPEARVAVPAREPSAPSTESEGSDVPGGSARSRRSDQPPTFQRPGTSFIGRAEELTLLVGLLRSGSPSAVDDRPAPSASALASAPGRPRLVTVIGAGGMGKTRLAHEALAQAAEFPDGSCVVQLAAVATGGAVADVVLTALGGRRQAATSPLDTLAELAAERRMLLVLDNCEHVLDESGAVAEAMISFGDSMVLATSREPLGVGGEQVVPLPPLTPEEAVALFLDRGRGVDPSFGLGDEDRDVIREICHRLDRMPLAVELAAARVRSVTVHEIAQHLGDRFRLLRSSARGGLERHRTLRAAMEWSYELLRPHEQALFRCLSVFAGGFTADAVVALGSDEERGRLDELDVLDLLDGLVARSMVVAERTGRRTRYALLETLRQLGADLLAAKGELEVVEARHAWHYLAVAESARRQLSGRDVPAGVEVFDREWSNVRVALDWFVARGETAAALRLVVACLWYATLGFQLELLEWAERALAMPGAGHEEIWPAAAGATSFLRRCVGDFEGADRLATDALVVEEKRGAGRRFEPAYALWVACTRRDDSRAKAVLPQVEALAGGNADPVELALARYAHIVEADIALTAGDTTRDPAELLRYAELAVQDAERTGNAHQLALAHAGHVAVLARDDRVRALDALEKALRFAEQANDRMVAGNARSWLALAARRQDPLEALAFVQAGLAGATSGGYWGNLDIWLGVLVPALVRAGRHWRAALLLGGKQALPAATPIEACDEDAQSELRRVLGPELERLTESGRSLTRRELAQLALQEIEQLLAERAVPRVEQ